MSSIVKTFVYDTILYGMEVRIEYIHVFLYRPAECAMVEDEVGTVFCPAGVLGNDIAVDVFLPNAESDIAYNEIFRASKVHFVVSNDDTVAGCGLSGQCPVLPVDFHFRFQDDFSRYSENNRQRVVFVLLECPAQRPFAVVIEIGNGYDFTTSASRCIFAETFRCGESSQLGSAFDGLTCNTAFRYRFYTPCGGLVIDVIGITCCESYEFPVS